MAPDFGRRGTTPELMDDPAVDFDTFHGCLVDLAKVNRLTLAYRPTLAFLDRVRRSGAWPKDRPLTILDVGSGHGDMLRRAAGWAARRGLGVRLQALDRNPWAARSAAGAGGPEPIEWLTGDLFDHRGGADLVISSLFAHHLDDSALARFLQWQEANARIGWFVNDLRRHPVSWAGFSLLARAMRWHPFVRHDGPVSIRRAFTERDWQRLFVEAGVRQAVLEPWFPFRLCVSRIRHDP